MQNGVKTADLYRGRNYLMIERRDSAHLSEEAKRLRLDAQRKRAASSLKCCPLCGAVNALTNHECFVCRWSGLFDHDATVIESALSELVIKCPELVESIVLSTPRKRTVLIRLIKWMRSHFHKPLDIWA